MKDISSKLKVAIAQLKKMECANELEWVQESIKNIEEKIEEQEFRIAVVGEFSSGKSTFINAIIGKDILLHSTEETTATITHIINVSENDKRRNTVEIYYHSGNRVKLDDLKKLADYTTAQSSEEVAENIARVDIFVHFLNTNKPLMIVDTPGLNGVADRHRDITISEIQKVHACIYVVPLRGLAQSDVEFIRELTKYQSQFIFVQNFKDRLLINEGETAEKKVEKLEQDLKEYLLTKGIVFEYTKPICLSALMALVSQDTDIKKLYESSTEIDDAGRKKLYKNSNYEQFKNTILNMMETGEYKKAIYKSAVKSIANLTGFLDEKLNLDIEEIEKLKITDKKQLQKQQIQNEVDSIETRMEKQKNKLENFVTARKGDARRVVSQYINENMTEIASKLEEEIDSELQSYDQVECFVAQHKKQTLEKYYSSRFNELIQNMNLELNVKLGQLVQSIYEVSLLEVKKMRGGVTQTKSRKYEVDFSEYKNDWETTLDFTSQREEIRGKKEIFAEKISLLEKSNRELKLNTSKLSQQKRKIDQAKSNKKDKEMFYEIEQHNIGKRPEYSTKKETREVASSNFLKRFFGITDTVEDLKNNSQEIEEWEKKNQKLVKEKYEELSKAADKISSLEHEKKQLENMLAMKKSQKERLEKELGRLQCEIKDEEENLRFMERNAKKEMLAHIKKNLKEAVHTSSEKLIDEIKSYSEKILNDSQKRIVNEVLIYYESEMKKRKKELIQLLQGDSDELDQKYKKYKQEIQILSTISKEIS